MVGLDASGALRLGPVLGAFLWPAVSTPGCSEAPRSLRLVIDTDLEVPEQIDQVRVTVTASRTDEGNVCEPVTRVFELVDPSELPLRVTFEAGTEYSAWVAFRVVGRLRLHGEEVFRREARLAWPSSGRREVALSIDSRCYRVHCPATEHCVNGVCVGVPHPGIFDDLQYRDRGVSCDRVAPIEDVVVLPDDAGGPDDGQNDEGEEPEDDAGDSALDGD